MQQQLISTIILLTATAAPENEYKDDKDGK